MFKTTTFLRTTLASCLLAASLAAHAQTSAPIDKDALRATLLESREKNRGVTVYSQGASIAMVVTGLEEHYVVGRNQQASRIVVRLDRIDAVAAAF